MIHYHGTPITPKEALLELKGRHFCVSFAAPENVRVCHEIGQSVMLDNGAFSAWRAGKATDWPGYYAWTEKWLDYRTTWAVIPDVIDGDEADNDQLAADWPHSKRQSAPVWHMHESIGRLLRLCDQWQRVCIGSSGAYAVVGDARWHGRMVEAMNALCGDGPSPVWLHMLRGLSLSGGPYPFASADSTDIARNHHLAHQTPRKMADRWDAVQCPARWAVKPVQMELVA